MAFTMTQSEYARHRGVSPARITTIVKQGKISGATTTKNGKVLIDPEKADTLLEQNLDPMNPPRNPKKEVKEEFVKKAGIKGVDYHTARTINEQYKAALRKLEFETKSGQLIPSNEVEKAWTAHITAAKIRLLGIKSKIAPLIQEYLEDIDDRESVLGLVDSVVREALEELSRSELQ